MKVEVRSKEIIRPSSPTPESLKSYKLSLVDQLALNFKIPFVVFYDSENSLGAYHSIDELMKSLSKTLSLMYPLAGRVKEDKLTIECNDQGVEFIVADVAETMSLLLDNPEMEIVRELIPSAVRAYEPKPEGKVLLVIQVNRFSCGGMAIALFISHAIGDGAVISTFLKTWAAINRGCDVNGSGFVSDLTSAIFPPLKDISGIEQLALKGAEAHVAAEPLEYTIRRFIFSANTIAKLRQELTLKDKDNSTGSLQRPSRTEALTAFVWAAVINASRTVKIHKLSCMVNLRNRMKPPLPPNCLGNLAHGIAVQWEAKEGTGTRTALKLVPKIRRSIRAVNDGAARKIYGEGGFLRAVLAAGGDGIFPKGEEYSDKDSSSYCLYTTNMCGLPFFEADFGWGKPVWVVNVLRDAAAFLDTINGGVEVWMGLPKEVMLILMQNHHFLGYVEGFSKSKL